MAGVEKAACHVLAYASGQSPSGYDTQIYACTGRDPSAPLSAFLVLADWEVV